MKSFESDRRRAFHCSSDMQPGQLRHPSFGRIYPSESSEPMLVGRCGDDDDSDPLVPILHQILDRVRVVNGDGK